MTTSSRAGRTGAKDLAVGLAAAVVVSVALVLGIALAFGGDDEAAPLVVDAGFGEIGLAAFDEVPLGAEQEAVERALLPARPVDPDVVELYEVEVPDAALESCLHYEAAEGLRRDLYRFCFVGDELVQKEYVM